MTLFGFGFIVVLVTTFNGGENPADGAPTLNYLPYGEWEYPGTVEDMRYPTCTLSRLKGGFSANSTMLDFAWLSRAAYTADSETQSSLDIWFQNSPGVTDLQDMVDEFRSREDPNNEIAVKFKAVSIPGPEEGQTTAIILIRGTKNQFDVLADVQLWSGAALLQVLRGVLPMGGIWSEIFPDLVSWINWVASTAIQKVAFYKLTTKFAEELKANDGFDYVQVTGHSLGGGLSLITGAQAKIPAIGISAPNALISGKSYDPPITRKDINDYGFNIIPEHDIVPKLDDVGRNWQEIGCTAELSTSGGSCHMPIRSLCEIQYTCGSGNRPVICECVTKYGYPEPVSLNGEQSNFNLSCPMPEE
jgi:lipase ATG15